MRHEAIALMQAQILACEDDPEAIAALRRVQAAYTSLQQTLKDAIEELR